MENAKTLIYDGSFNGFLTTVFRAFDENINVIDIQKNTIFQSGLFSDSETVHTQMGNAKSVWNGIQTKNHIAIRNIYFAFLSEEKGIELLLYRFIKKLFAPKDLLSLNFSDDLEAKIVHLAKVVGKEKQRMETSLSFTSTADGVVMGCMEPENDVLPLISRHYRFQKANTPWLIFDNKRNYGIYYNLKTVSFISLNIDALTATNISELNIQSVMVRQLHRQPMQKQRINYSQERAVV